MKTKSLLFAVFAGLGLTGAYGADIRVEAPFDQKGGHVQGLCKGEGCYYLSQMTRLHKIGLDGRSVKSVPVLSHTGDLCFHKGLVYASVCAYEGPHKGKGLIQVYDADLKLVREKVYPRGMDGITCLNGKLFVGNGCHRETVPHPEGKEPQSKTPHPDNDMAIVDPETLELERTVVYSHGEKTRYGAQNIETDGKLLYVSFYPGEKGAPDLVAYDAGLKPVAKFRAKASNGLVYTGETDGVPSFLKIVTTNRGGAVGAILKRADVLLPAAGELAAVGRANGAGTDVLGRFWRENDGKTVRRLPVAICPENVFWSFGTRDFSDGFKAFDRLVDEGLSKSTYNCITLTLRCNPELGDAETLAAAKRCIDKAHAEGVKVYMDTDPRIARREFFAKWPEDRQGIAAVTVVRPKDDGTASFTSVFKSAQDHMSWGSTDAYRPLEGRVAAAFAVRRHADGALDWSVRRPVRTQAKSSRSDRRETARGGFGHTDFSVVTVSGSADGLSADESLVVVTVADYLSADLFSPHLIPFCRDLLVKYREVGADGGMRDEWGFIAEHNPDWKRFFYSPHFAAAYRKASGRDMLADLPLMAYGPKGDAARTAAIGAYMGLTLSRNAEIERAFYDADKEVFGKDVYVCKHATWTTALGPSEAYHNGLDWWQATRDWAQGDELTPIYALNGMAKKFGGPVWLNEGYTKTPDHNVFRVWTYALCGGRQVYHGLFRTKAHEAMAWEERRVRTSTDLLAPGNVAAQSRVRLTGLITRAQVDCPLAFAFGHEGFLDWSDPGFCDHGRAQLAALLAKGWWCDAYPASEFALGTFAVDADGWLRVGQQRYAALATWRLRSGEKAALEALAKGRELRTKIFDGGETEAICAYLEARKATRQPLVKATTGAGPLYPEPNGLLRLIDGTAIRIKADWKHPQGLPIDETVESNGVKAEIAAEGLAAVRAEGGAIVALAAGGLRRAKGPGLSLELEAPEDIVLLKLDGEWHGIWQTARREAPVPAPLLKITSHWTRLLLPSI